MAYPFSISLGVAWNLWTNRKSRRAVEYKQNRHITIFGPTRSGKGVSLEIVNLLRLGSRKAGGPLSIISIDPKGQNCAVTARWRRKVSEVVILNPFNLLGLGSAGFNPLAGIDPQSPYEDCAALAEALIRIDTGGDPFWSESARMLILALLIWEVKLAHAAVPRRLPTLENVRAMLTDGKLPETAKAMMASKDFQLASLAGRFTQDNKTIDGIKTTADTKTQWLLSAPMRADLAKNGIDFATLKDSPKTVYVILPAEKVQNGQTSYSVWLRLVVVSALTALYRRGGGGMRTLFLLSEFAQLGKLDSVAAALAQGAGFGIQLCPVLQDINQLREIYGKDSAPTFLGMSGATFAFTPNDDETAEWMSKRSGEVIEPELSASDDPQRGSRGTWKPQRRRLLPPDDLYNIPEFHGLVWFAGRSAPQPVYAAPYWKIPELRGRYDADPYHAGSGGGHAVRKLAKLIRYPVAAAIVAALIAGAALLLPSGSSSGVILQKPEAARATGKMDLPASVRSHGRRQHATR